MQPLPCIAAVLNVVACVCGGAAPDGERRSLGVLCTMPECIAEMRDGHWAALARLEARPEVLAYVSHAELGAPFRYDYTEQHLAAFAEHGLVPDLSITLHTLPHVPAQPLVDESGTVSTRNHSFFDPLWRSESLRNVREIGQRFGRDDRVHGFYLNVPGYWGEIEYYSGEDWTHHSFFCYDSLARDRFAEWLKRRYETPAAVAAAWSRDVPSWESLPLPRPNRENAGLHADPAWLDLMQWRSEYLVKLVVERLAALAAHTDKPLGFKCSIGPYEAMMGTDLGALAADCTSLPRRFLDCTNVHNVADLIYAGGLARQYGFEAFLAENEYNRFGRGEIAKGTLSCLLAGADAFNYCQFMRLADAHWSGQETEIVPALADARALLSRYTLDPATHEIAFLHSTTSSRVRAPDYTNRDVARVYDDILGSHVTAFRWARWLGMPDIVDERAILDGALHDRRVLIVPNSGVTVLPERTLAAVLAWVRAGGTLMVFGEDGFGLQLVDGGREGFRVERRESSESRLQPVRTIPPEVYSPEASGTQNLGTGRIVRFPAPVPTAREAVEYTFFENEVPRMLRRIAEQAGARFPVAATTVDGATPVAPLALAYRGRDGATGRHIFIGGAHDGETDAFRLTFAPHLAGPAEIVLVDTGRPAVAADGPCEVTHSCPPRPEVYRDPTNTERRGGCSIPHTVVTLTLPARVTLTMCEAP